MWLKDTRVKKKIFNKKTVIFTLLILILISLCIGLFFQNAFAEDKNLEDIERELGENIDNKINDLDLSELEKFLQNIDSTYVPDGNVKKLLGDIIKGNFNGGFNESMDMLVKALSSGITSFLPLLITIMAIAIVFSLLQGLSSGFLNKSTNELIYFICYCAIIVILTLKISGLVAKTVKTIANMTSLMNIVFPLLITMITALDGVIAVGVYQPMMAVLTTGIVGIVNGIVLPCFIATMVLSIVGYLTENIKLGRLNKFFKSCGNVVLGVVFGLFASFITVQGITGAISDNISIKSAKFALSSYVPILGGYISDGFDLVMASVVLIKNAIGATGLIVLVSMLLMPVAELLIFMLGLKLIAGVIEPIGDKRMCDIVSTISDNLILLVVAVLGVAFMFFIMTMLTIYTCNLGVS